MKNIAHGAVVENHDFTQIRFDLCQILDVCAIAEGAVLAVVSATKVLAFAFDPVNDGICVLLHGCSKDYKIVPFADLNMPVSKGNAEQQNSQFLPCAKSRGSMDAHGHNTI